MANPLDRWTAASMMDVPKDAPMFGQHPATNAQRRVRFGDRNQISEPMQQQIINALRGKVKINHPTEEEQRLGDIAARINYAKSEHYK